MTERDDDFIPDENEIAETPQQVPDNNDFLNQSNIVEHVQCSIFKTKIVT